MRFISPETIPECHPQEVRTLFHTTHSISSMGSDLSSKGLGAPEESQSSLSSDGQVVYVRADQSKSRRWNWNRGIVRVSNLLREDPSSYRSETGEQSGHRCFLGGCEKSSEHNDENSEKPHAPWKLANECRRNRVDARSNIHHIMAIYKFPEARTLFIFGAEDKMSLLGHHLLTRLSYYLNFK